MPISSFPDHPPTFEKQIELLAAGGYDVVAPWLRGYAPSILDGPYDIDQIAHDVLALASALGYEKMALVGHDWGAIATYVACAIAPHRVSAAVALSIPHPWTFKRPQQLAFSAYVPLLAAPGGAGLARAHDFALVDLLWRRWSPGLTLDPTRRRALHACLAASWPAPARYYRALLWPPSPARLGERLRIAVPLLHLHGAEDGCVSVQTGRGQERFLTVRSRRRYEREQATSWRSRLPSGLRSERSLGSTGLPSTSRGPRSEGRVSTRRPLVEDSEGCERS